MQPDRKKSKKSGSAQESDGLQAGRVLTGDTITVHSAVCETVNCELSASLRELQRA